MKESDWLSLAEQRDAAGMLTPLAVALYAIGDEGCDCGTDEPGTCLGCSCEAALKDLATKLEASAAEVARLKNETEHMSQLAAHYLGEANALQAEVERLKVVIRGLMDACDRLMGDSDLPDDESFEMQAMQRAAAILEGRNDRRIERGEHWTTEGKPDE